MNHSSPFSCGVSSYLNLCAYSKIVLLVPSLGLNLFILASLVCSLCGQRGQIKRNVMAFVLGSTLCNLFSLALWPLTIHWKTHGRWMLGREVCELMVKAKHFTSSASFHYVSFISFSVYLTVVCGKSQLVNSATFLVLQLLFPFVPVLIKEICQWATEGDIDHMDHVKLTCFSYINDRAIRILLLIKLVVFIPLNLYFYAHILVTIFRSAKQMQRSQKVNKKLAKIFSVISLLTLTAHIPGGVFSLMEEHTVCQETVKEFLMDLPLLSSPVVLLCTNKELRTHCLTLLQRKTEAYLWPSRSTSTTRTTKTPENVCENTSESLTSVPETRSITVSVLTDGQTRPTAPECGTREVPHIYTLHPSVAMEMRHVNGHLPAELHLVPTEVSSKHNTTKA